MVGGFASFVPPRSKSRPSGTSGAEFQPFRIYVDIMWNGARFLGSFLNRIAGFAASGGISLSVALSSVGVLVVIRWKAFGL